jgi:alpha-tubulin suppressor-like RCC1 family protein
VSCGSAHILALNDQGHAYSWGCGTYGALGFGLRENIETPRILKITQGNE